MSNNQEYQSSSELVSRRKVLITMAGLAALSFFNGSSSASAVSNTKLAPVIYSVNTRKKQLAFSFDDGPWPKNTKKIMNHFKSFGLEGKATFFQVGNNIKAHREIAEEVAGRGYEIGNHSMTHRYIPSIIASEIEPTKALIESLGISNNLFRSPGLTQGEIIQRKLARLGMVNIFTDYDIGDWKAPRISSSSIASRTSSSIHKGSIVLLHDGGDHQNTVQAIPYILENTLKRGYQVVPVGQLIQQN